MSLPSFLDVVVTGRKFDENPSLLDICPPLVLCVSAWPASLPTLILALVWLTLGACWVGYRSLRELLTEGISSQWLSAPHRMVLQFYRLAWWPGTCGSNYRKSPLVPG
jgi:hypothetical protein